MEATVQLDAIVILKTKYTFVIKLISKEKNIFSLE